MASAKPAAAEEPPHLERKETWIGLFALGSSGVMTGFASGLGAEVGRVWGRFGIAMVGRYWLPQEVALEDGSAKLRIQVLSLGIRACSFPINEDWVVSACLGAEIGDMHAEGVDVEAARLRYDRWSALLAGVRLGRRVTPHLVIMAGLELGWALERPEFGFIRDGESEPAYRPSNLAGLGYLGVAIIP